MPVLVPNYELQPGMRLDRPILHQGRVLLTAGKELTQADVQGLQRRYADLLVRVADPILDEKVEFEDDSKEREIAERVRQRIAETIAPVLDRVAQRASLDGADFARTREAIDDEVSHLQRNPTSAVPLLPGLDTRRYLANHTATVFHLSISLATAARDYVLEECVRQTHMRDVDRRAMLDLTPLGLGVALMDLGMLSLQHRIDSEEPLSPEDRECVRNHPVAGAEMLPDACPAFARLIVKSHHESYDGSGYPKGLMGDRLHVFSRLVRITDAFAAATAARSHRAAKSAARALWEMTAGPYHGLYDPTLMKAFGRLIQPFPIGAKLRLSDGRYAVVVQYNRQSPLHPHVLVAFDADGNRLPESQFEGPFGLAQRPDLHVTRWGREDLAYIYQTGNTTSPRPDLHTLIDANYP